MNDTYEVFAVRYGTLARRRRRENFLSVDIHDGTMPLDYYVWVIRNSERTVVFDTGFDAEEGRKRNRNVLRAPREALALLDVDAAEVKDVVISHMHYDHAGTTGDFPKAAFHLQEREMVYATGPDMAHGVFARPYTPDHVCDMVRAVFLGRVSFHDGASELAPGIVLHLVGGHTPGLQCVQVRTRRGWVVLASDACHFYENLERVDPFPVVHSVGDLVRGYRTMRQLAESADHIIPGHDPLVMSRYPSMSDRLKGVVVRLDVAPD